ncbi:hypothetical protein A5672_07835 [Mycobacterium alsense]|uniref:Uncharacterized protein n=1 Tax=Mycobacterium alsense TaxID=324058 RepID=A0ABD6P7Y5_9MYCO|nr:hypothetical protein [Mycobacterium alsense]OBG46522.1 hypothetical protein A5672_07835 [Mycobacterium alsense]
MSPQDPEERIAELERQLAQQKRIADLERQLAEAKSAISPGQPAGPTIHVAAARRYDGIPGSPRRLVGADRIGAIIGMLGGAIGLCFGGAAAVTALIPSTALWMSALVCGSGYDMAYNTSHYSYKPGQSGTTVSFQCVNRDDFYDVNYLTVFALQSLLAALLLCVALAVGGLLWRRGRPRA